MTDFTTALVAAFLPLFVAINIPGILPIYIGMTETFTRLQRRQLLIRALAAAAVLAVLMLFAGEIIFASLGITLNDLRVGGGLILLVIAVTDLAFGDFKKRRGGRNGDTLEDLDADDPDLPVVPLGIPLIIGPGAITTILLAQGEFGYGPTLASILHQPLAGVRGLHLRAVDPQAVRQGHLEGRREGGEPVPGGHLGGDDPRRRGGHDRGLTPG